MKRVLSLLLVCILLISIIPLGAAAQAEETVFSRETVLEAISDAPVMEFDFSQYSQLPIFSGVAAAALDDNVLPDQEPNNYLDTAVQIFNDVTVYGSLSETDDIDVFRFDLTGDSQIVLASASPTESLLWGLFDAYGEVLAVSEDMGYIEGFYGDGIGGNLPAGTYYVAAVDEYYSAVEYVMYFQIHSHTYTATVTPPTCGEDGYTTYSCSCGSFYEDNYVSATGSHVYADDADTTCDVCGYNRQTGTDAPNEPSILELPFTEWEWEVLRLVNVERTNAGLAPLTGFSKLQDAAYIRAEEIMEVFSHSRPDGSDCFTAFDDVNLNCGSAGENIAAGQSSPAMVMNDWMNSSGHRGNILGSGYSHIGISEKNWHWVQMFTDGGKYTSIYVIRPEDTTVRLGTPIEELELVAVLNSSEYGECYMPVASSYCTGYDPYVSGLQTVTISVLGVSNTFELDVADHTHNWADATCTAPQTCTICGSTRGAALGHRWEDATCTEPKTCLTCGETEGDALGHSYEDVVTDATCVEDGYTTHTCTICGSKYYDSYVGKTGHIYENDEDPVCKVCGGIRKDNVETTPMYRLYNPNSGEHFYTGSIEEKDNLVTAGWRYEGIAWNAPVKEGTPVYRVYNPNSGDHHYTMSAEERDDLVKVGWQYEGVCWNSASVDNVPLYRLYNPNADCGSHHYTSSAEERNNLVSAGWEYEGIGWFGMLN